LVFDIGKNSFHIVVFDQRGAIVLRQKWSRGQVESRFVREDETRWRIGLPGACEHW